MLIINNNFKEGFSNRLIELRKEKGLSQEQLAEKCDIKNRQTIAKWEHGESFPDAEKLLMICDVLGCDAGYLLGQHEKYYENASKISSITGLSEKAVEGLIYCHDKNDAESGITPRCALLVVSRLIEEYAPAFEYDYTHINGKSLDTLLGLIESTIDELKRAGGDHNDGDVRIDELDLWEKSKAFIDSMYTEMTAQEKEY